MSNQLLFSIVIPAHNEEDYLTDCLKAAKNQAGDFDYEIIVVDNNSIDKTAQIAHDLGVKVVSEPRMGVGRARRTGTQRAQGKYILQIDADTRLPKNYLLEVYKRFKDNPGLVCLGGQFLFFDAPWWKNALRFVLFPLYIFFTRLFFASKIGVIGNNMSFKKEMYDRTAGFNPRLKFAEDGELCRQLSKFGQVKLDAKLCCYASVRRFKFNKHFLNLCYYSLKFAFNKSSNYDFPYSQEL